MAEKFRIKKTQGQQGISRNLDNNSYHAGPYHTIRPQDQTAYDPWADWFNAGLDPEPFADHFDVAPAGNNSPWFFDAGADYSTPWYVPEEQPPYQGEADTPPRQDQPEYPAYQGEGLSFAYPGYLEGQDNQAWQEWQEWRPDAEDNEEDEEKERADLIGAGPAVTTEEPTVPAGPSEEESREKVTVKPPSEEQAQREEEAVQTEAQTGRAAESVVPEEKSLSQQEAKAGRPGLEPLVWKAFPEKSC